MNVAAGIDAMRHILAKPGGIVRLVGLSGMGKTRLAQALFDSRFGTHALDSAAVAYTDQGHAPDPAARDMLQWLGVNGSRAIVVVDNCNPEMHHALAQMVAAHSGIVSLLTIEYDVADDEPEATQVFRLEPASADVLVSLLARLAPQVSQPDRHRIAEFSGCNARMALALAKTLEKNESLGRLNDGELFRRLFQQRNQRDDGLLRATEVCALVYSFDVETLDGETAELPVLAALAEQTTTELYRHVAELRTRDLVQQRSRWRAVLPPAMANRLAHQALLRTPAAHLPNVFAVKGRERLLKSFSRRLGYLHECEPAKNITDKWLSEWFADVSSLNDLEMTLFQNLAPVLPAKALQLIETAASGERAREFLSPKKLERWKWINLLRSLAYESELFDRSALLLAQFRSADSEESNNDNSRNNFVELFHLHLSGTHARIDQRLALIRTLLSSPDSRMHACALEALDAALEAWHFGSSHQFSFGARPRDFGWQPGISQEVSGWYRAVLSFVREIALSDSPYSGRVTSALGRRFRGLWLHAWVHDDLEKLSGELSGGGGWIEGWLAVRATIRYDSKRMPSELSDRLLRLEQSLRPSGLAARVQTYVLSRTQNHLDIVDIAASDDSPQSSQDAFESVEKIAESLGRETVSDSETLEKLLPYLLAAPVGRLRSFGSGLAIGSKDVPALWKKSCSVLSRLPVNTRNVALLFGILSVEGVRNPELANRLLDEAVDDPVLGPHFPELQTATQIGEIEAERLSKSLKAGLADIENYQSLGFGRAADAIPSDTLKRLLLQIADREGGFSVAAEIFGMRMYSIKNGSMAVDEHTLMLGRELLLRLDFQSHDEMNAHRVNEIARFCLDGEIAAPTASALCERLARKLSATNSGAWNFSQMAETLFRLHPIISLDNLVARSRPEKYWPLRKYFSVNNSSPVDAVPTDMLLIWADRNGSERYPKLASEIRLVETDGAEANSFSELALHLFDRAPNRAQILEMYSPRLIPSGWSGSLADVLAPYLIAVQRLQQHSDKQLSDWAIAQERRLRIRIEQERQQDRRTDESFE